MGKIDHIEAISNELAAANTVIAIPRRCNHVRNHNSKCKRCFSACKHNAINRNIGQLIISAELCTGCGACVAACPASAITTNNPRQNDIVLEAKKLARHCDGVVCFVCNKWAKEAKMDTSNVIVLPCLDYLDEYLLCGLFACGATHLAIFQPSCEDCSIDSGEPYINKAITCSKTLLDEWNVKGKIKVFTKIPNNMCNAHKNNKANKEGGKRSAFAQTGASVLDYVTKSFDNFLATDKEKKEIARKNDRIVVAIDDVDPAHTYKSVRILTLLKHIGTLPSGATINSKFWCDIHIDKARCHFCGACATFCPTRALKYTQKDPSTPSSDATLTFQPQLCTGCMLCKDSCIRRALLISNRVSADNLKDETVLTLYKDEEPHNKNPFGF